MKFLYATLAGALSLLTISAFTACDATFHDNLSDCRHTLWVTMAKNDCNAQSNAQYVAPAGDVRILAFDKNGFLAADTSWTQNDARQVQRIGLHTLTAGNYTVLGWAGISSQWEHKPLEIGKTHLSDVLLKHRNVPNEASDLKAPTRLVDLNGSHTWTGRNTTFVKFPAPSEVGSTEQEVQLNMHEQTFQISLQVDVDTNTFDGKNDISANDFDVEVEVWQQEYRMDGTPVVMDKIHEVRGFVVPINTTRTKEQIKGSFTVPALTARDSKVKLTLVNRTNGKVVEQGTFDLLALLMLQQDFDPSCARGAKLLFKLKDRCLCGQIACEEVWVDGVKLGKFSNAK